MASDLPNTGAAFTYSLELDVIKIQDLYTGTKRVADDIKSVLRKIESWHQGPIIESVKNSGVPVLATIGRPARRTTRRIDHLTAAVADLLQPAILRPPTFL